MPAERRASSRQPARAPTTAGRAAWGTISRGQVIDAASKLVATRGYEQLTIRALAAELGVAPMSLYRHMRDKNDVLDEVVDRVLSEVWRPTVSEDNWQVWITDAAETLRNVLVTQPAALSVYLTHPVVSPTAVTRMQAMLTVLRRATGSDDEAGRAYAFKMLAAVSQNSHRRVRDIANNVVLTGRLTATDMDSGLRKY